MIGWIEGRTKDHQSDDEKEPSQGAESCCSFRGSDGLFAMREHVDLDAGVGDCLIGLVLDGLEFVPGRCFLGEERPGCEPEDDGCDFEAEMCPVEVKLWEPQGSNEYLLRFVSCGMDYVLVWGAYID